VSRSATSAIWIVGAAAGGAAALGSLRLASAFLITGAVVGVVARVRRDRTVSERWQITSHDRERSVGEPSSASSAGDVHRQLGTFEARKLLRSGWLAAGVGTCVLAVVTVERESAMGSVSEQLVFLAHPLVGMVIVWSHRAATRAERDGASELYDSCAVSARSRSIGVLWSAWVPVAVLSVFFVIYITVAVGPGESTVSDVAGATVANLAAGLVLGVGGIALGVVLARLTASVIAPIVAIVAVGFVSVRLGDASAGAFEARMLASTFGPVGEGDVSVHFTAPQATAHLAVMLLLTGVTLAITVSVRSHRRSNARLRRRAIGAHA
jgi:hypothetical protein